MRKENKDKKTLETSQSKRREKENSPKKENIS